MAQFFVNRGGGRAPEGPFEEQQIIRLILAGKIRTGYIRPVEGGRFVPIEGHVPFAQALVQAGVLPPSTPLTARAAPANTRRSRGLLVGAVLAVFGIAVAAVAIGAYVMFSIGGMLVQGALPIDTEVFVEVPSVEQLLSDLSTVRALEPSKVEAKHLLDATANDLSQGFGVSKAEAQTLLIAASSFGVAGRKLGGAAEGGVLLSFSGATPVNAFLSSKRFTYTGLVARNGRKYKLSAAMPAAGTSVDATGDALSIWSLDSATTALVWFETSKVLFVGSESFAEGVSRVLSMDAPSFERSQGFRGVQRELLNKPDAIGYFDGKKLTSSDATDPRLKTWLGSYLKGTEPITATCKLVPVGLLTHFVARGADPASAKRAPLAPAVPLTVVDRLPVETFAYAALASKTQLSGAELRNVMLDQLTATDPELATRVNAGIYQIEARLHVHFDDILGSIGDQAAVAVLAAPEYSAALGEPRQMLGNFAIVYAQALKNEAPLRELTRQLKTALDPLQAQLKIQEDADGYTLLPSDDVLGVSGVSAQLRFTNGYLFVALGNTALVERSRRAFTAGENTLATDPAHRAARAALPSQAQLFAWVDAGRIVDTLQKNPLLAARAGQLGLSAVHWTGPERVTAALAVASELQNGVLVYRVDSLNFPAFPAAFAGILP